MDYNIKINLNGIKEIIWPIYFLSLVKLLTKMSNERLFVVYVLLVIFLAFYTKKITIPQISGLGGYLFFIVYSSVIGFFVYPLRDVA